MRIYAIDDEPKMLRMLHDAIAEAEPSAEILDFSRAPEVMEALSDPGKKPDAVFSDIDLPGISGLTLVVKIKAAAPQARPTAEAAKMIAAVVSPRIFKP